MSSFVLISPEVVTTAAADLDALGSAIRSANAAAAGSTPSVIAAAQDEVSTAISRVFGSYAHEFQALSAQAALFHEQFVQTLTSGSGQYAAAEAASADPLTTLVGDVQGLGVFEPVKLLTGRPLIGNGGAGATGGGSGGTGGGGGAGGGALGESTGDMALGGGGGGGGGAAYAGGAAGDGGAGGNAITTASTLAFGGGGGSGGAGTGGGGGGGAWAYPANADPGVAGTKGLLGGAGGLGGGSGQSGGDGGLTGVAGSGAEALHIGGNGGGDGQST